MPPNALTALKNIEVTNDTESGDGFQLTFSVSKGNGMEFNVLQGGPLQPFNRVVIGVMLGVIPHILIDGIITHHQLSPGDKDSQAYFTVTGKDLTVMMDLKEKNDKFENQPDSLIISRIIGQYAEYGLVPLVTPTPVVPLSIQRITRQHETDLQMINRLAERNGYIFYIEPVSFGVNRAYWGPEQRIGVPQPAITIDMGAANNATGLRFSNDSMAPVEPEGAFVEPFLKTRIPIPLLPSLRFPPIVAQPAEARRTTLVRDSAKQDLSQAANNVVSRLSGGSEPVTAEGEVDTIRYGKILRARKPVGVRGAGVSYNGIYFIRSVTHRISNGEYKQSFSLSREGTGSLLPVLPTS